jgi:hypothetical protein
MFMHVSLHSPLQLLNHLSDFHQMWDQFYTNGGHILNPTLFLKPPTMIL